MPPKIELLPNLEGDVAVVFMRQDAPFAHGIALSNRGQLVVSETHYPCEVCAAHDVDLQYVTLQLQLARSR